MRYQFSVRFYTILIFMFLCTCMSVADTQEKSPFWVRVLLDEKQNGAAVSWTFGSEKGFIFACPGGESKKIQCHTKTISVSVQNNFFYINGKKLLKKQCLIFSKKGLLEYGGNFYKGSFFISLDANGTAYLINSVDLEAYIFAVLRSESWPGWPLEVNKVFAIVTRSYVISKLRSAKKRKRPYHIKNTRIHQTYNGHRFEKRNSKILQQAVDETAGVFLAYDDQPIVAMFDSCCGGIIPSKVEGVDFKKAPYLAREYACKYCKRCSLYSWHVEYSINEWTKHLKTAFPKLQKVRGIKVVRRDSAGLIQELKITGVKKIFLLTGKKLYSLLDAVKSFCFTVHRKGKKIVLKGRGYGHHLGLCQWGAREMVRDSWNYRKIIQFYYPDVSFVRLA